MINLLYYICFNKDFVENSEQHSVLCIIKDAINSFMYLAGNGIVYISIRKTLLKAFLKMAVNAYIKDKVFKHMTRYSPTEVGGSMIL